MRFISVRLLLSLKNTKSHLESSSYLIQSLRKQQSPDAGKLERCEEQLAERIRAERPSRTECSCVVRTEQDLLRWLLQGGNYHSIVDGVANEQKMRKKIFF